MFSLSQNKNQSQELLEDKNIPVHTMSDDLQSLETTGTEFTSPQKTTEINQKETVSSSQNPFLQQSEDAQPKDTPITQEVKKNFETNNEAMGKDRVSHPSKLPIILSVILVFLIIISGGYYFWITRKQPVSLENEPPQPIEEPHNTNNSFFSVDTPNYLPIDTKTATPETLKQFLAQTAGQATTTSHDRPLEFYLTDQNNNRLPFSVFTSLMNIPLSPGIFSGLGENFSLFIYFDQTEPRIGLAIDIKDVNTLTTNISAEEAALPKNLEPLFLDESFSFQSEGVFQDSVYKNFPIRYLNVEKEKMLSIDYSITPDKLIIATSKDTGRAILDILP